MSLFGKKGSEKQKQQGKAAGFEPDREHAFGKELDLNDLGAVTGGVRLSHENIYAQKEENKGEKG